MKRYKYLVETEYGSFYLTDTIGEADLMAIDDGYLTVINLEEQKFVLGTGELSDIEVLDRDWETTIFSFN